MTATIISLQLTDKIKKALSQYQYTMKRESTDPIIKRAKSSPGSPGKLSVAKSRVAKPNSKAVKTEEGAAHERKGAQNGAGPRVTRKRKLPQPRQQASMKTPPESATTSDDDEPPVKGAATFKRIAWIASQTGHDSLQHDIDIRDTAIKRHKAEIEKYKAEIEVFQSERDALAEAMTEVKAIEEQAAKTIDSIDAIKRYSSIKASE